MSNGTDASWEVNVGYNSCSYVIPACLTFTPLKKFKKGLHSLVGASNYLEMQNSLNVNVLCRSCSRSTLAAPTTCCCSSTSRGGPSWSRTFSGWTCCSCQRLMTPIETKRHCMAIIFFSNSGSRLHQGADQHQDGQGDANSATEAFKGR